MEAFFSRAGRAALVAIRGIGPIWFTSVMGTGILAACLAIAPAHGVALTLAARFFFALACALFASYVLMWAAQIAGDREPLRASLRDVAPAQAWGAPPMACFTIAVGCLKIGAPALPGFAWTALAQGLWIAGAMLGLFCAFYVPYLMFTRHELTPEAAYGSWLLPVVPPIVASVPAALLATTWPLALRGSMLAAGYALLGLGTALAAILIVVFYSRLLFHKVPEGALVTTMWLVVGPLGQSVAGILALGTAARAVWPAYAPQLFGAGLAYGVMVWGFGVYWLAMAIATTVRAARRGLPFALGWWAFTFPVGTLTAGSFALGLATNASLFNAAGLGLLALLAAMWALVFARTLHRAGATLVASYATFANDTAMKPSVASPSTSVSSGTLRSASAPASEPA